MKNSKSNYNDFDSIIEGMIAKYSNSLKPLKINIRDYSISNSSLRRSIHNLHKYPAKLLFNIPHFLLNNNIFSNINDIVLDPFCGSGTVLLEAILAERNAYGAEINPFARLITEVKITSYDIEKLKKSYHRLSEKIKASSSSPNLVFDKYWFNERIRSELQAIYDAISTVRNNKYRSFFILCLSTTVSKVSFADPRIYVPVRFKKKQNSSNNKLFNENIDKRFKYLEEIDVSKIFYQISEDNIEILKSTTKLFKKNTYSAQVICNDARKLLMNSDGASFQNKLKSSSVDFIVTSPPYAGAQKYIRSSRLSLPLIGLGNDEIRVLDHTSIGKENCSVKNHLEIKKTDIKEADRIINLIFKKNPSRAYVAYKYIIDMKLALSESVRVLKKEHYFVLIIGNNTISGYPFENHIYLNEILVKLGMTLELSLLDNIQSFGMITKRNVTANIIKEEWIQVYKKK